MSTIKNGQRIKGIIGGPVCNPAANFPRNVKASGGLLIEVKTDETPLSAIADVVLRGPSGEVLPHLVCCVMEMLGDSKACLRKRTDSRPQTMRQRQ